MDDQHTTAVFLTKEHMQTIARMFDIAVRSQGIQVIKQVYPVLNILDQAIQENEKMLRDDNTVETETPDI